MTDCNHFGLDAGPEAFARLAPHVPSISGNFEIPMHVGKLIAAWDRPKFVAAESAIHMRDDDYVVGLVHNGVARAYPMWVTDNYHMINDKIGGDPVLYATCERCQSGSAFLAEVQGQPAKFSALGMHNASLTMMNRKRGPVTKGSLWLHYEGVAITGPEQGNFLRQLATYHMTWEEWRTAHPESDVMLAPDDVHHRDARHGHGREEIFARPGMDQPLASTITTSFDTRYPENEVVLGINIDAGIRAYPLVEVKRSGSVVNDVLGELPIVVFAGPRPEQVTLAAFCRIVNGEALSFELADGAFRDLETGSTWSVEGQALAGPLAGESLIALRGQYVRWHAWVYPHPESELYTTPQAMLRYADLPDAAKSKALVPVVAGMEALGLTVYLHHQIVNLSLPHEAKSGVCVFAGNDRLNLYEFESASAAEDYVAFQGAWFCWPFGVKVGRKRAARAGRLVVESDPTRTFAEPTQIIRYPDEQIPWSFLVQDEQAVATWSAEIADEPLTEPSYRGLIAGLKARRIDTVEAAYLPHSQQRPGTLSCIAATLEAGRFAIYRCESEAAADAIIADVGHAIRVGTWVFRSIPVLMYEEPHYEMGMLPDEKIDWSPLLGDAQFRKALEEILGGA